MNELRIIATALAGLALISTWGLLTLIDTQAELEATNNELAKAEFIIEQLKDVYLESKPAPLRGAPTL